jgi:hypothetical protein
MQQVIDEIGHPRARRLDAPGVLAAVFLQTVAVLLYQECAESAQPAQRGAQVVGDRVGESLQLLVRPFQVSRALLDADFEFGVECPDFVFSVAFAR